MLTDIFYLRMLEKQLGGNSAESGVLSALLPSQQNLQQELLRKVSELSDKLAETQQQTLNREIGELRAMVANLLSSKEGELEKAIERLNALKNVIDTGRSEDFEKWKLQMDQEWRKWMWEQQQKLNELAFSREQMNQNIRKYEGRG
ncbi:MAG: hypothetical protein ACTSSA_04760 [Candidatus Freyarchaeota archaeon]